MFTKVFFCTFWYWIPEYCISKLATDNFFCFMLSLMWWSKCCKISWENESRLSPFLSAFMSLLQTGNDLITRVLLFVLGGCFFDGNVKRSCRLHNRVTNNTVHVWTDSPSTAGLNGLLLAIFGDVRPNPNSAVNGIHQKTHCYTSLYFNTTSAGQD